MSEGNATVHEVSGFIREVNAVERSVRLLADGIETTYDLAPVCAIVLHGERVKLRLLQPKDYAHISYTETADGRVAHAVRVNWWFPQSEEAREARQQNATTTPAEPDRQALTR